MIATKGVVVGACVIDESFQGELRFNLHNVSENKIHIHPGHKIVQGIIFNIDYALPQERKCTLDEFYPEKTIRGSGWNGSTNNETR